MLNVFKGALYGGVLASAFVASSSQAGFAGFASPVCYRNADGSAVCYGTFRGFRENADPNARADFYLNSTGLVTFYGSLNGQTYSCFFDTTQYAATFGSAAGQELDQFFVIGMSKEGKCSYSYLYQGSSYNKP